MKSQIELVLTSAQVIGFMENLGLNPEGQATYDRLRIIVQRFLELVPFQNLTMIIGPMRRPTWEEICKEMLCGNGGLCTTRNPFMMSSFPIGFRGLIYLCLDGKAGLPYRHSSPVG